MVDFIRRADAVLVDVTHRSENIDWELRSCAELLGPGQLILAYSQTEGEDTDMSQKFRAELNEVLGEEVVQQSLLFGYRTPCQRQCRRAPRRMDVSHWLHGEGSSFRRRNALALLEALQKAFAAKEMRGTTSGHCVSASVTVLSTLSDDALRGALKLHTNLTRELYLNLTHKLR